MSVANEIEVTQSTTPKKPIRQLVGQVGNAYKFAWHTCLGAAVTAEEKITEFAREMAEKGAKVEFNPPRRILERREKLTSASEDIKHKAQERIEDVEHMIDEGVNRSLHFMGVPSRKDMDEMTSLMKDMADSITELSSQLQAQKSTASRAKKTSKTESTTAA
ncbi:phasin family protein [Pseudomaricurvus alkylphenolicus]|uniref:phasin family protein n=1 Tax=Pseudomaricurvus alkylphenolicus TaxID=1306991 RepID=UPI00141E05EB|nr:phasin family protein [Pseudomaricurvus alkylphenolicus]NIB39647.1 phasin family protein [Pseudomaricurvus alkylphenolicus]